MFDTYLNCVLFCFIYFTLCLLCMNRQLLVVLRFVAKKKFPYIFGCSMLASYFVGGLMLYWLGWWYAIPTMILNIGGIYGSYAMFKYMPRQAKVEINTWLGREYFPVPKEVKSYCYMTLDELKEQFRMVTAKENELRKQSDIIFEYIQEKEKYTPDVNAMGEEPGMEGAGNEAHIK